MAAELRQLRLTPLAVHDLEEIWRYTRGRWSLAQAERYHRDLIAALEALARGEKVGRPCMAREGYLRYPVGAHVAFYRESERTLDVIRVLHQRMDVERHL
jgi:toxin ParE1/3/4